VIDELNDPEIKGTDERNPDKFGPVSGQSYLKLPSDV
jgi:hypothetical protein